MQNEGLGSKLLEFAKAHTAKQNLPLTVTLDSSDNALAKWFAKRGFEVFDKRKVPTYPYDVIKLKAALSAGEGS